MPTDAQGNYYPRPDWWPSDVDDNGLSANGRFANQYKIWAAMPCPNCNHGAIYVNCTTKTWQCKDCRHELTIDEARILQRDIKLEANNRNLKEGFPPEYILDE